MPPLWPGQDSMRAVFRSPDLVMLKPAVSPKAKPPYRTTSSAPPSGRVLGCCVVHPSRHPPCEVHLM